MNVQREAAKISPEQKADRKEEKGKAEKTMDGKSTRRYESSRNKWQEKRRDRSIFHNILN